VLKQEILTEIISVASTEDSETDILSVKQSVNDANGFQ